MFSFGYLLFFAVLIGFNVWVVRFFSKKSKEKAERCTCSCKAVCIDAYSERHGSELSSSENRYICYVNVWEFFVAGCRYTVLSSSQYIKYWVDKGTESIVHYNPMDPKDAWVERVITKASRGKAAKVLLLILVLSCAPCIVALLVFLLGALFA